jgi:hypothetical protein
LALEEFSSQSLNISTVSSVAVHIQIRACPLEGFALEALALKFVGGEAENLFAT